MSDGTPPGMPRPDPALRKLDRFVGTWSMRGHLVGSNDENIVGEATFQWLKGGFFMQQDVHLDFAGMFKIDSREIIGYDPQARAFSSLVYSNMSPMPLPYRWQVTEDTLTISVQYPPLDATFTGRFKADGSFAGGWRPNPGADANINVPYDISGTRKTR